VILNTMFAVGPLPSPPLLEPHSMPGHHVFTGSHAELVSLLAARSDLWVQDPASSLAIAGLADLRPRLILDLCAGQGTKTRQLAAAFPEAKIIATDIEAARFRILQSVFHGHPRVEVVPAPGLAAKYRAAADLVLLDVPCSNSGVLARRPEAKYRFDDERQTSLIAVQQRIISDAVGLVRPGPSTGSILYSTCSIERAENEDQGAWAAEAHALHPLRERRHQPTGGPGEGAQLYSDGSYSVLLGS
jgi:16S rRNA (cytosine967-C5)-methyltransferase